MTNVLGLDIGGANTKAAFIRIENGSVVEFETAFEYFPFWKRDTAQLRAMLGKIKEAVCGTRNLDCLAVTLTAELSDAYQTKREGVNHILSCVQSALASPSILVLDVNARLISVASAKAEPFAVAAANWAATGWMVAQYIKDCVVVDVGSTSTSIIPIASGRLAAAGKNDLEKLICGELVYTGSLRTNVAAIVRSIPVKGNAAAVSSEFFAQSADVHLALGNITETQYIVDTPDGKGKSLHEALVRLARVVCADTEMLTKAEIGQIAAYIYDKQVKQVAAGLNQVYSRLQETVKGAVPVVVTGLGQEFLAKKAAEQIGVKQIISLEELLPKASLASPAVGVALMAASTLEGRRVAWMQ